MTAQEARAYYRMSRKLVEVEERSHLMEKLISNGVGFKGVEDFARKEVAKQRFKGEMSKLGEKRLIIIIA